jgi:hypothetical protein
MKMRRNEMRRVKISAALLFALPCVIYACPNSCPTKQSLISAFLAASGAADTAAAELASVAVDEQAAYDNWDAACDHWDLASEVRDNHYSLDWDYQLLGPWDTYPPVCDECWYVGPCREGQFLDLWVDASDFDVQQKASILVFETDRHELASEIASDAEAAATAAFLALNQHLVEH